MTQLGNDAVTVETRGNVMLITINRPEARNAVNAHVHEGVGDALVVEIGKQCRERAGLVQVAGERQRLDNEVLQGTLRRLGVQP